MRGPLLCVLCLPLAALCSLSAEQTLIPQLHSLLLEDAAPPHGRQPHTRIVRSVSQDNITAKVERLKDNHQQLLVHWTGKESNVFICLARNNWDHLVPRPPAPSAVYISYDSGTTYENKTDLFKLGNNGSYASVDKFYNHPKNQNYMVFVDQYNKMLYVTKDYGKKITKIKPQFQPIEIVFYPENPAIFLVHDVNKTLWITRDFGDSFNVAQEFVKLYSWADRWPGTWTDTPTRSLLVQRIEPYSPVNGSTLIALGNLVISDEPNITVELRNIEEFIKIGDFVFVTRMLSTAHKGLLISYKGGEFYQAEFGGEFNNSNYHIVDVSEVRVMVAVAHNETLCNLYISEVVPNSNYIFRLSLERLFCYFPNKMWTSSWLSDVTEEKFADLHKVKGLRGIYFASQVTKTASSENLNPEHLQTLITFDWGGEWKPITPPTVNEIGQPISGCGANCTLHLTQKFMNLYPYAKTIPILTSASAPGLIMATGVLGVSLKGQIGVFVSRDAGLTWKKVLRDDYIFNFGDHGGIMAAVKYFRGTETQELLYSTDEGESWKTFRFIDENIKVYNLMTEPGENTTTFTLFGSEVKKHGWIIVTIDLRSAFKYNCTNEDYKPWSPSGGLKEKKKKSVCVMGLQEVYQRRIQHSNCYNGRDNDRPVRKEPCACDIEDFECDFGFTRHVAASGCIRNKSNPLDPYRIPSSCRPGQFYNRTKGYRKIDGDACYGGFAWQYLPQSIPCPFNETNNFLLVALKKEIARFNLHEPMPKKEVLPIRNLVNVIAIEFDMKNNCVFYGDVQRDVIVRQCLSGKTSPEILVENGVKSVEGLAYDWISQMLYFVDGTTAKIEVIRTDIDYSNRMRKTILDKQVVEKPRGIALHPVAGYMYWTDWSRLKPHVGRANLNGSNFHYLFSQPDVYWPNGITIDHFAEQIYWVDAKLDYIATADLHGRNFRKVIQMANKKELAHPFSVAVFKDLVYWDDWEKKRIFVADKDHGIYTQALTGELEGLMDLKVFAHSLQEGTNACTPPAPCSHLCFAQPENLPHVCTCPDDMILKNGECLCLDGSAPFANHTCPKSQQCLKEEFQCHNNVSCIPLSWKCNGHNDCSDNSDEMDCPFQTCSSTDFRCPNGRCIPKYWVCDSDNDCEDGGDERNCTLQGCQENQFQCGNKKCISKRWRCDGDFDCEDHSDEANCHANTPTPSNCTDLNKFQCEDKLLCIPESWKCDGVFDCKDSSDEANCSLHQDCDAAKFQCEKSKKCIYQLWRCDGDYDCGEGDKSDEANCTSPVPTTERPQLFVPCKEFMFKCSDNRCIPEWWKCDGVSDCVDGIDEVGCPSKDPTSPAPPIIPPAIKCHTNEFLCGSSDCIPSAWVCDGHSDCTDSSDEANCTSKAGVECPGGYLKCHFSNSCYLSRQACDGHFDCPDHSDEKDCANKASTDPSPTIHECPYGSFKCPEDTCFPLYKRCNHHKDCLDGFDEDSCQNFERVYQVSDITLDMRKFVNSTTLPVSWTIDKPGGLKFEYLPSISLIDGKGEWKNHSEWVESEAHVFSSLLPFSSYNLTVYVRLVGKPTAFPPAVFVNFTTQEDVPSPPWNVKVVQSSGDTAEVHWTKPTRPNGLIKEYHLFSSPPLPPLRTIFLPEELSPTYHARVYTNFDPGAQYSFWVVAVNSAGISNSSEVVQLNSEHANIGAISKMDIQCPKVSACQLTWKEADGASGYKIQVVTNPPYPKIHPILLNKTTSYTFKTLAPGVSYRITINGFHKTFQGREFSSSLTTAGVELPVIQEIGTKMEKQEGGYSVSLSWKTPRSEHYNEKWTYGIYYGTKASHLFDGPKITTTSLSGIVEKLEACETYLFDVGVVEPLGYGPLSTSPARLTTGYHRSAPPKGLTLSLHPGNETLLLISWRSSCFEMKEPVGYIVKIEELVTGESSPVTLLPTNNTKIQHTIVTDYGARYRVRVRTSANNSVWSWPAEQWAPLLPSPHQVKVERYRNNSAYLISWQLQHTLQQLPRHEFEVLLCEGEEFNESHASSQRVKFPPYILEDLKQDTSYSVAVRLVSEAGYRSPLSEINSIRLLPQENALMSEMDGASVVSVFLLVFAGVLIILLGAMFAVYAVKHHRLRNSFASFANSHYSTTSGAAIFTDRLDDEDSPVIRGFSDDEPLVVA